MIDSIIFIGAGSHAAMLLGTFDLLRETTKIAYVAPEKSVHPVFSMMDRFGALDTLQGLENGHFVNGLGTTVSLRHRLQESEEAESQGLVPINLISETSAIFSKLREHAGLQILANSVVQPGSDIGRHCVINTSAVIEHDTKLGAGAFIAPAAVVLGGVEIGECAMIGAGAIILPGVKVGADSIVGAGSVVLEDVPSGKTVLGAPARELQRGDGSNARKR